MMTKHHQDPKQHQTIRWEKTRGEYNCNRTGETRNPRDLA